MLFNYINLILEVTAHVFRAFGACIILLPLAYFVGASAIDICDGLSIAFGVIAVSCAIMAAAATYMELEQAAEEVRSFRYWRAAVQKM